MRVRETFESTAVQVDPNAERPILQSAVKCFKKQQHFQFAKETLMKLGEPQELITLYIESAAEEEMH